MIITIKRGTKKQNIQQLLDHLNKQKRRSKGINAQKYCGILRLNIDPLEVQKTLRNEWE